MQGLPGECCKTGKAVYDNDFMNTEWVQFIPKGHVVLNKALPEVV